MINQINRREQLGMMRVERSLQLSSSIYDPSITVEMLNKEKVLD